MPSVADGAVVPSAAVADPVQTKNATASTILAPTSNDMPGLVSDSDDCCDYSDADAPSVATKFMPSTRQSWALRILGLLLDGDSVSGTHSRRAFRRIEERIAARAVSVINTLESSESDDSNVYSDSDVPVLESKFMLSPNQSWALRALGLLKEEDGSNGSNSRRELRFVQGWVAARAAADRVHNSTFTVNEVEHQQRGT